jgi:hypothetical protein
MTDRERRELEHNRRAIWDWYVAINPPLHFSAHVEMDESITLDRGRLVGTGGTLYASFIFDVRATCDVFAENAAELDSVYVRPGKLYLRESWLDSRFNDHNPPKSKPPRFTQESDDSGRGT